MLLVMIELLSLRKQQMKPKTLVRMMAKLMLLLRKSKMQLLREPRKSKRLQVKVVEKVERNPLTERAVKMVRMEKKMLVKMEKMAAKKVANYCKLENDCLKPSKFIFKLFTQRLTVTKCFK